MERDITFYDRDYKRTCASIGWALLLFLGIYRVLFTGAGHVSDALEGLMLYKWHYTLSELMNIAAYLLTFLLPAFFLRFLLRKKKVFTAPDYSFDKITANSLLLIPATIGVAILASFVNTLVMDNFGVTEAYRSLVGFDGRYDGYQIVLLYVSTALVPAFCEEFLFRGTILANLTPYGKRGAVMISALLFGLMHQNPYQIIYTTVSGLLLGMAYIKTGSIWLPTAIHFLNNAYSVTSEVIYANVEPALATAILTVLQLLIVAIGVASFIIYLKLEKKRAAHRFDNGFFGREIEPDKSFSEKPISKGIAFKGFARASIILYIVATVLSMATILLNLMIIASNGIGAI